jgi:hypothetical protein
VRAQGGEEAERGEFASDVLPLPGVQVSWTCANCGKPSGQYGHLVTVNGVNVFECESFMRTNLFGDVSNADDGERSANDFYETPAWMTRSLLHFHSAIRGNSVLECASGNDAITTVLRAYGCIVFTNDIDPRHPAETHHDATNRAYWLTAPPADWVVSNLPFGVAFDIMPHALLHASKGVAMLLRKSWTEPTEERGQWLHDNPPTRIIGLPRHNFRGSGSGDSVSCDWHLWERGALWLRPPIVIDHVAKARRFNEV